ncbi:pyridoxal phosphate-dependent transferase [Chlamydoabsidia padenii]|nr:pyridoxal phosphate-dependent transferase [Chlamydoabsidia padenii]
MINFLKGQPSSDLLPIDLFKKATSLALDACNADIDVLQYGDALGTMEFRENLAKFLSKEYSMPVDSRHLCPTSGASFGLQHALSLLTRPNSVTKYCYFQEPTYFLAFDIFRDVGFQLDQFIGIPDNTRGLDIDHFEASLVKHLTPSSANNNNNKDIYDAVLYCVPTHANPTGSVLPTNQRQRLVELARKYNVLVICDDVYDMLTYSDEVPPKRLVAYDLDSVNPVVISNGSFSKILAPGARIGWLECHENLIERLGRW